jgi:biotin-dependent carboxylase-like uncharacterized protein
MVVPFLRVIATGPGATIQDRGRPGWFNVGVGVSGAADTASFALANRLVGNGPNAAVIECVLGGLIVEAGAPVTVAVTGAPAGVVISGTGAGDDPPAAHGQPLHLSSGQRLELTPPAAGLRVYLAVRGGIDVPLVLGSRSRDTLAGLGPEPLRPGDELPVGPEPDGEVVELPPECPISGEPVVVRVMFGPRDDWFVSAADLLVGHWLISDRLDRVGVRLDRPAGWPRPVRTDARELPPEGMPLGAIQVPPSGEPVVFLADHPITGGYPVIAVVVEADLQLLAQARPGQTVLFRPAVPTAQLLRSARLTGADPGSRPRVRGNPTAAELTAVLTVLGVTGPSG